MSALNERLRAQWEALSAREKRLVQLLGAVAAVLVVLLPVYLLTRAIDSVSTYNAEIIQVLADIERAEERLAQREAERAAAEARYNQRAPELGTYLESRSAARHITIASVTNQPEVQEGRYRKRHVRAVLQGLGLRDAIRLMVDLESAPFPIALERVHLEHFGNGDRYNLEIGVITYDRSVAEPSGPAAAGASRGGRAGPAAP